MPTINEDIQAIKDNVTYRERVGAYINYFTEAERIIGLRYVRDNWPRAMRYVGGSAHFGIERGCVVTLTGIGTFVLTNGVPGYQDILSQ